MDKRYQVFISSTYTDLKDERQVVFQTLMEMDCIPAGMELFPAADEEQFNFIKKIIDDCDYYILILGGRYGSVTKDGVSYTEMEFEYAIEQEKRAVVLVHGDPKTITLEKSDTDPALRQKLEKFREKACTGRLVKFWTSPEDLAGKVALSLQKTIKMYPAQGWVRAPRNTNEELLEEVNKLRRENETLRQKIIHPVDIKNLASIDEIFTVRLAWEIVEFDGYGRVDVPKRKDVEISWKEIFSLLSPHLLQPLGDGGTKEALKKSLFKSQVKGDIENIYSLEINEFDFQTIRTQFEALGLVKVSEVGGSFWKLTESGRALMFETKTIKSKEKQ